MRRACLVSMHAVLAGLQTRRFARSCSAAVRTPCVAIGAGPAGLTLGVLPTTVHHLVFPGKVAAGVARLGQALTLCMCTLPGPAERSRQDSQLCRCVASTARHAVRRARAGRCPECSPAGPLHQQPDDGDPAGPPCPSSRTAALSRTGTAASTRCISAATGGFPARPAHTLPPVKLGKRQLLANHPEVPTI